MQERNQPPQSLVSEKLEEEETMFQAALQLHGGSPEATEPAEFGLLDTVVSWPCSRENNEFQENHERRYIKDQEAKKI